MVMFLLPAVETTRRRHVCDAMLRHHRVARSRTGGCSAGLLLLANLFSS